MLVSAKEIKQIYKITNQTLYNWRKDGRIEYIELNSKKFMYKVEDKSKQERINVIYGRVSNTKQKDDLDNQIKIISEYMISKGNIVDKIYKDIASGMNENRNDFNQLISDVIEYKIDKVYISFKDRLTRFGFTYFENLFKKFGTEIIVLNLADEQTFQNELANDLISIIHHFSMKLYSNRRKKLKEIENLISQDI